MIAVLKHINVEGPGTFGSYLKQAGFEVKTFELYQRIALPVLKHCEGVLVMGGSMNVYETDKYPFLLKEEEFLKKAIDKNIPILGICLGAQILAKIIGAKIYKAAKKEIGWYNIQLVTESKPDLLLSGLATKNVVFQWHEDTFDIPKKGVLIAKGLKVKNQAFRLNDCVWGLQYHPEMTSHLIRTWAKETKEQINKEKLLQSYFLNQKTYLKQAKKICSNFAKIIKRKR